MPLLVAYVGRFQEDSPRHLSLHAQAVVGRSRKRQIRINRGHPQEGRGPSGATGRVGYIAILECRGLDKWWEVELRENNVAFGFVVEKTDAAANSSPIVLKRRIGKTKAWPEEVLRIIEATRRSRRNRQYGRT